MKNLYIYLLSVILFTATGCKYTFPEDPTPTGGSADLTKLVTVGDAMTAGFMDGALYDAGQAASFPNLVAQQMQGIVISDFNQPDIASPIGYLGTAEGIPGVPNGTPMGHLIFKGLASPAPTPIIPGNPFNPGYGGDKSALNNFGVAGMRIIHAGIPGYGMLNPYFGRFALDPAESSVLGDATAADGSFFTFWVGANDVWDYALAGGTGNIDGTGPTDMTPEATFAGAFGAAITAMLANGAKGVVANIPYIQTLPHFTTVPWNAIPMDQASADAANGGYVAFNGGIMAYNAGLLPGQDPANPPEIKREIISFNAGQNGIVMYDSTMADLNIYGIPTIRQSNNSDLITLSAGAVLGKELIPDNPATIIGVGVPLAEKYTLILANIDAISFRTAAYNDAIADAVTANSGNLSLLDISDVYIILATTGTTINGSGIDGSFVPPFGAFSLDGVHPNQRGAAYFASLFIDNINVAFGANIPNLNPNDYPGNSLPVP